MIPNRPAWLRRWLQRDDDELLDATRPEDMEEDPRPTWREWFLTSTPQDAPNRPLTVDDVDRLIQIAQREAERQSPGEDTP